MILGAMLAVGGASGVPVDVLDQDDGLPSSNVLVVDQDAAGYLWIGSADGLARYDGLTFKLWQHEESDPNSLPSDRIETLFIDAADRIWVGTEAGGLAWLGKDREAFTRVVHDPDDPAGLAGDTVWEFAEGGEGTVWLATSTGILQRFDPTTGVFERFETLQRALAGAPVFSLAIGPARAVWVGTVGAGLVRFQPQSGDVDVWRHAETDPRSIGDNVIFDIEFDATGRPWVGTSNGISVLEEDGGFRRLLDAGSEEGAAAASRSFTDLHFDAAGSLWGASRRDLVLRAQDGEVRRFRHDLRGLHALPDAELNHIFEDREGQLWLGTEGGG
ncbi:MAG: two-component regulator propeller domain-containing protein, partial [Pseudomonadota bacterium]